MSRRKLSTAEKLILQSVKELHAKTGAAKVLDIIRSVQKGTGMKPMDIMEIIIELEKKGLIKLIEEPEVSKRAKVTKPKYPEEILDLKEKVDKLRDLLVRISEKGASSEIS
ncbi:MAG: hypothetical protein DRO05_07670 [Thermoproteota archaeon]|nr:MAG: hypothetical protein DRO05_07670 [Candidatus Korarchaeota archaeon]